MAVNPSIQLGTSGNWAIKEDNLLAYKQLGNKFFDREFDFSRGTTATFVGRNGFIQESGLTGAELVTNGDFATDSNWAKINANISNGLATITVTNGVFSALTQSTTYATGKEYIVTAQIQGLSGSSGKQIKFQDRGNNTGGLREGNGLITLDETLQNIEISWTANSNSTEIVIARQSNSGDYSFTIDNVSVKEIQRDVPRIDFTDDTTGHLLLEPQSTNLLSYSEDFNNNYWSRNANVTTTNSLELAPNGKLDAQIVKYNGTGYSFIRRPSSPVPSTAVTLSVFAKKGNWRYLGLRTFQLQGASHTTFDFDTETFVNIHSTQTASFETFSNGWYRIKVNQPSPELNNLVGFALSDSSGSELNTTGGQVANVHLFGAQLEESSYATSYIPTSGSISTRNQETCNNSGTVNDFNSEEGVLYGEIAALSDDLSGRAICISNDTNSNRVLISFSTVTNQIQAFSNNGITSPVNLLHTVSDITVFHKIAFKYKLNDFALWVDGVEVAINSSGNTNVANTFNNLKFENASGTSDFFGKTKNLKAFKRALTDTELYLLTVTQYQSYQEMATALNYTL